MELEKCINFLLSTAQNSVFQYLTKRLSEFDITPSQYGVLSCLWESNNVSTPKKIAEKLHLETSTVSGILDRMQKKNLIDRVINKENRREIIVVATDEGNILKEPVLKIIDEVNEDVLKMFTANEIEFLRDSLDKISNGNY